MTIEHQDLEYLKKKFEDGDRPIGEDFENLLVSCHNTRQDTDVTITGSLSVQDVATVDGRVNGRNISSDGAKLDSVYSNVHSLSTSWEESADIQALSDSTDVTIQSLSGTVDMTTQSLSATVDMMTDSLSSTVSTDFQTLSSKLDNNTQTLDTKIDYETQLLSVSIQSVSGEVAKVATVSGEWNDTRVNVMSNSAQWAEQTDITDITQQIDNVETTVQQYSAAWGVDEDTQLLSLMNDVELTTVEHNDILRYDSSEQKWYPSQDMYSNTTGVTALTSFKGLEDTPVAYTGAGKFVQINNSNDGLMFVEHDSDSWDDTRTTVSVNSAFWSDHTDTTNMQTQLDDLQSVVVVNSAEWTNRDDISGLEGTIDTIQSDINSTSSDLGNLQESTHELHTAVATNSAQWGEHTDVTDLHAAVATNSAHWGEHTDITDLQTTVSTNSAQWAEQTDTTDLQAAVNGVIDDVTGLEDTAQDIQSSVDNNTTSITNLNSLTVAHDSIFAQNSANWSDTYSHVLTVSTNWAVLDSDGKVMTDQIPELSITQTYTVQNPEEVQTLNPVEGIQRGDVVIVNTTYDNLIAKQDNPTGAYNSTTKAYSGYSKLARPDAFVTSVNDEYGNVTLTSDDIPDEDQDNKWVTQAEKDNWNATGTNYVNVSGDIMSGDLDTQSNYLSSGVLLHDIFSTNNNILGDQKITGDSEADSYKGTYKSTDTGGNEVTGITQDVNVGGNILHIVNGIIVGVTDES